MTGYIELRDHLLSRHVDIRFDYAHCQSRRFPDDPDAFVFEFAWAVLTASRHRAAARPIMDRLAPALKSGQSLFPHCLPGEAAQIEALRIDRKKRHATARAFHQRDKSGRDLVAFLQTLPGMSGTTAHRLARNLGAPVAVPDEALTGLSDDAGSTPQALCDGLATTSGDRPSSVGLILSRAVEHGLLIRGPNDGRHGR